MNVRISAGRSFREGRNILIRGTNWIGDAVMTLSAIAAVRQTFPQAKITILVKPWVAELFNLSPDIDEIMLFQSPGIHEGMSGKWRLVRDLKERKFDTAILLQNAIEAAIITLLAGIPVRAGYDSDVRGSLLTHSVERTKAVRKVHQTAYYLEMVRSLGCEPVGGDVHLKPGREYDLLADALFRRFGLEKNGLLVGMAPGAAYGPAKKWFSERFSEVAERLGDAFSPQIILFGSAGDADSAKAVQKHTKYPLNDLTGQTSLKEAIALMSRCRLFISNDSGLMHVAAALGVPTVAIFGSTNPATTAPVGRQTVVIHKEVSCSPCLRKTCPTDFRCMEMISVDDVYGAAIRFME
jgi:heptosyltransferase II